MNLYQIAVEHQKLINDAIMQDEVSNEALSKLRELEGLIDDKAISIASAIKNLEAEQQSVELAIHEMTRRVLMLERKKEWLKLYLKQLMETYGVNEIRKSPHFVIKVKKNPPKVIVDDGWPIPDKYLSTRIETVTHVNKSLLKQDLEKGEKLDCAYLQPSTRIEIK